MLTCAVVAEGGWVERYVTGKLSESEERAFESHFLTCSGCQQQVKLAATIRGALRAKHPPDTSES